MVTFTEEILNGKLHFLCSIINQRRVFRGGPTTATTSKMEHFVIMEALNFITKCFILDVAAVLDPPLVFIISTFHKVLLISSFSLYPVSFKYHIQKYGDKCQEHFSIKLKCQTL